MKEGPFIPFVLHRPQYSHAVCYKYSDKKMNRAGVFNTWERSKVVYNLEEAIQKSNEFGNQYYKCASFDHYHLTRENNE